MITHTADVITALIKKLTVRSSAFLWRTREIPGLGSSQPSQCPITFTNTRHLFPKLLSLSMLSLFPSWASWGNILAQRWLLAKVHHRWDKNETLKVIKGTTNPPLVHTRVRLKQTLAVKVKTTVRCFLGMRTEIKQEIWDSIHLCF